MAGRGLTPFVVLGIALAIFVCQAAAFASDLVDGGCRSGRDCAVDECCLLNAAMRGRRYAAPIYDPEPGDGRYGGGGVDMIPPKSGAICQKLGVTGSPCTARYPPPNRFMLAIDFCPCTKPLTCINAGPQGQLGIGTCGLN